MISVRGRDVTKGLGGEMGEPELEEGEACFYQEFDENDNDYDPNVDLDVALSYIDEKLHNVLGHFQKDFEAGINPQNLGAKFGDYGSFLPTYQRAPAWSHLMSPGKIENHKLDTSLSKSHHEGGLPMLRRHEEISVSSVAKKTEAELSGNCVNASSSKFELDKNYGQASERNNVKARVEIGSNNLSTQRMATLGVDFATSSFEESPIDFEGDVSKESPTRILQIMTSPPVDENLLLSPLTEYLINLTIKQKKLPREGKSITKKVAKASQNTPYSLNNDSHNIKEKKPKTSQNSLSSSQLNNLGANKEIDSATLIGDKLAIAASQNLAKEKNLGISDQSKRSSELKEVKAVLSSEAESNVSRYRQVESAELFRENDACHEEKENELQLTDRKEKSYSGRTKKPKGTRVHEERENTVPEKERGKPKANEDKAIAVNIYKDLFGEMELDEELDLENSCSIEQGEDDMATVKHKFAPTSKTEKKLNVKKIDSRSFLEANVKSPLNPDPTSAAVGPLVEPYKVPLPCEVEKENGKKEAKVQINQDDKAQLDKSSKKKVQVIMNKKNLNGTNSSPPSKELESACQPNVAEKLLDTKIENDICEQLSSEGELLSSKNNSKRAHDEQGHRISKKVRRDSLPCLQEGREKPSQVNGSHRIKAVNKSSFKAKGENVICNSDNDKGKANIYDSGNESMDYIGSYETKLLPEKICSVEDPKESTRSESTTKSGDSIGLSSSHDQKQDICLNVDKSKVGNELGKTDRGEISQKGRPHSLPPSGRGRSESINHSRHQNQGEQKKNGEIRLSTNTSEGDIASKALKPKKSPYNNGITSRQSTANGHSVGDKDISSSGKRDSSSHTILKEAKDLKHLADRLKRNGASAESAGYYFEAALKFLHGAFLLETSSGESATQSEVTQSMQIYGSTGQMCGFCAQLYEKSKDMATAALAYKCMEVAYMRVIYSSRGRASRDCHELETASRIGPPGESPLSSASDIDNINNSKADKAAKNIVSPSHLAAGGSHVISAANRPSFDRLLSYAQDVNFAMEASRKCKIAFAAAKQRVAETKGQGEGIFSVKRALDFNFQDVEGFLRLVRLAMEAISR